MSDRLKSDALHLAMLARQMTSCSVDASGVLFTGGLLALLGTTHHRREVAELVTILMTPVLAEIGLAIGPCSRAANDT